MDSKQINFQLRYQIREYLEYYWKEVQQNNNEVELKIIGELSDNLQQDLMLETNKLILKESPIFSKNFSESLIHKTVQIIKEKHCTPDEFICHNGEFDDCSIYFLEKGKIELYLQKHKPIK